MLSGRDEGVDAAAKQTGSATSPAHEPELRIEVLGGFRVHVGARTIPEAVWGRRAAELVKLLALQPGHRLPREHLMERLWPELGVAAAVNNLHQTLHAARRTFEPQLPSGTPSAYLRLYGEGVALSAPGLLWIDLEAFELATIEARAAGEPAAYEAALARYSGDLLPLDMHADWAASRREQARGLYRSLLLELAALHEQRGEFTASIRTLEQLVASEPTHEQARVAVMRLHAALGRRDQALQHYRQLEAALRRELDVEPDAATQRVFHQILAAPPVPPAPVGPQVRAPSQSRARPSISGRVHHLLEPATSFVGRDRELDELPRLLAGSALLTLTGTGGVGKSRLARQLAAEVALDYPGGAWLVDLAALTEPALLPRVVAAALGLKEEPDRRPEDLVAERLGGAPVLLLLDNCEHLAEACARLVDDLLRACPDVRVLATSRVPLGLARETVRRVPSLSTPDPRQRCPLEALVCYEAVRLFLERASRSRPEFVLRPDNAAAVAQVCHRLDGIPLAIELAAARLRVLSVQDLAARLGSALDLLAGADPTALPRHRTLRATLDWSYELLGEPERALFRRLAVFAGGWTLEAAERVGEAEPLARQEVLDALSKLVDHSLAIAEEEHRGSMRYQLLEVVRQYAAGQLEASGELGMARRAHRDYYLELAEEAEPKLLGAEQAEWLARLEAEHDNLRAALRWSVDMGDAEAVLRLGAALWRFWWVHGHLGEGRLWLERALATTPRQVAPGLLERALNGAGVLAWSQGDLATARRHLEECLRLRRELRDTDAVGRVLTNLGSVVYLQGDLHGAAALFQESLALVQATGNRHAEANALNNLAMVARDQGDLGRAKEVLEACLAVRRELGDQHGLAKALANLGIVASMQGDREGARARYGESLNVLQAVDGREGIAYCLEGLGAVAASDNQPLVAARLFGAAEALREAAGWPLPPADRAHLESAAARARGLARPTAFERAWAEGREMPLDQAVSLAAAVAAGERAPRQAAAPPGAWERLTPREREIARLLARGLTNRQIAEQLVTSRRTIDLHVQHVLHKLGLASRAQVAAWVAKHGAPESGRPAAGPPARAARRPSSR